MNDDDAEYGTWNADTWKEIDCRALRKRLGLSQVRFARRFCFPVSTLRQWERGTRRPSGAALALLHVIDYNAGVACRAIAHAHRPPIMLERVDVEPLPARAIRGKRYRGPPD